MIEAINNFFKACFEVFKGWKWFKQSSRQEKNDSAVDAAIDKVKNDNDTTDLEDHISGNA